MNNRSESVEPATIRPAAESPDTAAMPNDAIALLAEPRRRHAIQYLVEFAYPVSLRTLAAHVVAAERDVPKDTIPDEHVERAAIALHHADLPDLVAADLADYDPESHLAVRTAAGERAVAAAGLGSPASETSEE